MPGSFRIRSAFATLAIALLLLVSSSPGLLAQMPTRPGIQVTDMDPAVDPGEDFYRFANGGWLDRVRIPDELPSYGTFEELQQNTMNRQIDLLNQMASSRRLPPESDFGKAARFYLQGLDLNQRNAEGIAPVQPLMNLIDSASNLAVLHSLFATPEFAGIPDFFNISVTADPGDSSKSAYYLAGPKLGLPDVDYYTEDTADHVRAREAYQTTAANLFELAGMNRDVARESAAQVYAFEVSLAQYMVTPVEAQDFSVIYNPTPITVLQKMYPLLDWVGYVRGAGAQADGSTVIINSEVELLTHLQSVLQSIPFQTVQDYLTLQTLLVASDYLSEDFTEAGFALYQALYGVASRQAPEVGALNAVNAIFPDTVGRAYVETYFSPEAKAQVEALVANLKLAFRTRLQENPWMTAETRQQAIEKLDSMRVKVGYPDRWETYEHLEIAASYWETAHTATVAQMRRSLASAGLPMNPESWVMPAQMVNAAYNPLANDITFPAGILQAPFFEPNADPASNYGAIGYVIGHEITHAFDLQGAQFDERGNYADWWNAADDRAFAARNDRVVAAYDRIEVLPALFVDGQLTVTENVADLGGMQTAYDALQLTLAEWGDPGPIDGLTQNQRFFLAGAQIWREKFRDESLRTQLHSDEHSPGIARGTLPAANMDEFYTTFEIGPNDPMYVAPEDRVEIW